MFCWHKWSKWTIIREGIGKAGIFGAMSDVWIVIQKRNCLKCDKKEVRTTHT